MSKNKKCLQEDPTWKKLAAWVNADEIPQEEKEKVEKTENTKKSQKKEISKEEKYKKFRSIYIPIAVMCIGLFMAIILIVIAKTPPFGVADAPTNNEVATKYIEDGLKDTGATNIVASMILDYRAFDTLGEATVLFTAVMSVIVLLRKDEVNKKNKEEVAEEELNKYEEKLEEENGNIILRTISKIISPFIILFGIYVILNGHISPGGGFSGGAIIGAGLILISLGLGHSTTKKFFNFKVFTGITSGALLTYAGLKTYSFFTGANHIDSGVPLGVPGAILSSGFILPLNICVGMVVASTMFGFYSLFSKGEI